MTWVEITRAAAVRHQIRAEALAETTHRLVRVVGLHRHHQLMLHLLQRETQFEYSEARRWMELHAQALIEVRTQPWMAAA